MRIHRSTVVLGLLPLLLVSWLAVAPGWGKPPVLDNVEVKLVPCDPFPYVEPGTQGKVAYELTNRADHPLDLSWSVEIQPPGNPLERIEVSSRVEPGKTWRVAMPDGVAARRGVARFKWTLRDVAGRELSLEDTLGIMSLPGPQAKHREGFRFGVGSSLVHFVPLGYEPECMAIYAQMGIDLIRVGDRWAYSESRGDPAVANANNRYWDDAEKVITAARKADLDVMYVMWGTPPNLVLDGFSHQDEVADMAARTKTPLDLMVRVSPPQPEAWDRRVHDTVSRFKDQVRWWEIWNDQDRYHDMGHHMPNGWVGSTDEYIAMLRAAHKQIKKIDPELRVLVGGFHSLADNEWRSLNPDMQRRVLTEASDAFDIYATLDTDPSRLLGPVADLRGKLVPPRPMWITRAEQRGSTPDEVIRRMLSVKGSGAQAFVWMWGPNFDSGNRGLFAPTNTWRIKDRSSFNRHSPLQMLPAGCAFIHAIGLLRDLPVAARLDTGTPGHWLFHFASPPNTPDKSSRHVIGFWRDDKAADADLRIQIGEHATCRLLDLYGNATTPPVAADHTITIPLRREPAYIEITATEPPRLVR